MIYSEVSKYVVCTRSNTQRVVAIKYSDGSWMIGKEWRKKEGDEWLLGKGINLPMVSGHSTSKLLSEILLK